jgi:hypothetical protein
MLKFILEKETDKEVVYRYYPEGTEDGGLVSYDKEKKECSIVTLSAQDRHQRYACKMFARIRAYATDGFFEKEGTIAWY